MRFTRSCLSSASRAEFPPPLPCSPRMPVWMRSPSPVPCLGPLNEPLDIIVCCKSVVLLRALEADGAPRGSILMVDTQPVEDASVLFHHGAAQDVLYKRRWRRLYAFTPCTDTANSGAAQRALKLSLGLVLAAVMFMVWCCFCRSRL